MLELIYKGVTIMLDLESEMIGIMRDEDSSYLIASFSDMKTVKPFKLALSHPVDADIERFAQGISECAKAAAMVAVCNPSD